MSIRNSLILLFASCETLPLVGNLGHRPTGQVDQGKMSCYSVKTNYGTATASGEWFSNSAQTAAHKTLPMQTMVKVTNLANGHSEVVRINDRGPYIYGRIIDVCREARLRRKRSRFLQAGNPRTDWAGFTFREV